MKEIIIGEEKAIRKGRIQRLVGQRLHEKEEIGIKREREKRLV